MSDAKPALRHKNLPPWEVLKPQGKNRYIARVHKNEDLRTAGGVIIAQTTQDIPTTGDIVALSPYFEKDIYPDMEVGMCVKVGHNGWRCFKVDGEDFALGDASSVFAVYDPNEVLTE